MKCRSTEGEKKISQRSKLKEEQENKPEPREAKCILPEETYFYTSPFTFIMFLSDTL